MYSHSPTPVINPVDPSPVCFIISSQYDGIAYWTRQAPQFPIPMEYASENNPPSYTDMDPFAPRALPKGGDVKKLTAEDLKPGDDGSLELIDKSIKEMNDCKAVFDGLVEGIEK